MPEMRLQKGFHVVPASMTRSGLANVRFWKEQSVAVYGQDVRRFSQRHWWVLRGLCTASTAVANETFATRQIGQDK
jgi:hypothetical protein